MDTPRRSDTSRRSDPPSTHPVGGGRAWRTSMFYLSIALVIAACGLAFLLLSPSSPMSVVAETVTPQSKADAVRGTFFSWWPGQKNSTPDVSPSASAGPEAREANNDPAHKADSDPTLDLSNFVARGTNITMNEVIEYLHQLGIYTGLGAFNPPGTRPPLVGLAVPDYFVLPEGYVRHYQATDDGQRIEPILMFAPDYQIFDSENQPIEMPKDRVVTPELAPPGFPIRRIVIPAPNEQGKYGP
jgi:hypothetical protein